MASCEVLGVPNPSLRPIPFSVRPVSLGSNPPNLDDHGRREADKEQYEARSDGHAKTVPADILPHAVSLARGPGHHRLVSQVPSDVCREFRRRAVPSASLLLQCLHGDRVEVSLELASKRPRVRVPFLCHVDCCLANDAQLCTRPRRFYLLQLSLHFLVAGGAQLLRAERQLPRE